MLFPFHDSNPIRRTPWVTYGLVALNAFAFLVLLQAHLDLPEVEVGLDHVGAGLSDLGEALGCLLELLIVLVLNAFLEAAPADLFLGKDLLIPSLGRGWWW